MYASEIFSKRLKAKLSASRMCTRLDLENFLKEHWTNNVRTRPDQTPQMLGRGISRTYSSGLRRCNSACLQRSRGQCCTCQRSRSRCLALLHPVARCLPATLGGILAASHPEPTAASGLAKFFQQICPLTPRELVGPLQQLHSTDAADPFWFVQQSSPTMSPTNFGGHLLQCDCQIVAKPSPP